MELMACIYWDWLMKNSIRLIKPIRLFNRPLVLILLYGLPLKSYVRMECRFILILYLLIVLLISFIIVKSLIRQIVSIIIIFLIYLPAISRIIILIILKSIISLVSKSIVILKMKLNYQKILSFKVIRKTS